MTVDVAKAVGTKYVITSYLNAFQKVLENNIGNVLDLGNCRLGFQAAQLLKSYYGKITFVNSSDLQLNEHLAENNRRSKLTVVTDKIKLYPPSYDIEDVHNYISSLKEGIVYQYRVDSRRSMDIQMAFLTLLILTRPEITIDAGFANTDLCGFLRDEWLFKAEHHDCYYEVDGSNLIVRYVVNGYVSVSYRNDISEDMYRETFKCVPYEFGNKYLFELEEWEEVVNKCFHTLSKRVHNVRSIKDFITTR